MNRTDLIDLTNNLRDQLRLVEMAAGSIEDSDDAEAIQRGLANALEVAELLKSTLVEGSD